MSHLPIGENWDRKVVAENISIVTQETVLRPSIPPETNQLSFLQNQVRHYQNGDPCHFHQL